MPLLLADRATTTVLRATAALGVVLGATAALSLAARRLWAPDLAPVTTPDAQVALVVTVLGCLAGAALVPGCALLLVGALARAAGRPLRRCERLARQLTPALLRRAVAVGVGASLGWAGVAPATAQEIDLGWEPTGQVATDAPAATTDAGGALGPTHAPDHEAEPLAPLDAAAHDAAPAPPQLSDPRAPEPPDSHMPDPAAPDLAPAQVPEQAGPAAATPTRAAPVQSPAVSGAHANASTPSSPAASAGTTVLVRAGDSLWSLAAAHLEDPTDAEVAAAWPRWFAANDDVIADPDLIHPGQRLRVPGTDPTHPTDEELS